MVSAPLAILRVDEIPIYATARALVALTREVGDVPLHVAAVGVAACVAGALRAASAREEICRLREAELALTALRL